MIPPNIAICRALVRGLDALSVSGGAGKALWDDYFADEIEHASAADVDRWYSHFLAHRPRVERAWPRRAFNGWPYIAIPILSEADDRRFVGDLADRDEEDERFGVLEEAKVGVFIYAENPDELDILHLISKQIIRGSSIYLATLGVSTVIYESGTDVQPNELLPETVLLRGQTWALRGLNSTVVNLGPRVENVYVHLQTATFTAGDDEPHTGGVEA